MLVDQAVAARSAMAEATAFDVRSAVDKDLERMGESIRMAELAEPIPLLLRQLDEETSSRSPGLPRAAESGRKRDQLRAGWGWIQSSEHVPGGLTS